MKGCMLEDKGGKQHWLPLCLPLFARYLKKKNGTSEKGCNEIEDWGTSVHFVLEFQENFMESFFYCFFFFFSNKKNSNSPDLCSYDG